MKKLLLSTLALLMCIGISGCSSKSENDESIETTGDTSISDTSHVHWDYKLLEPQEMMDYEKFITNMTTDMGKIVMSNQDKNGIDIKDTEEMKNFAKTYSLSGNMHFTTEFFDYTKKIYDGANGNEGELDNKLAEPKQINLNQVFEGYMPMITIDYSFNESLGYNIDSGQFSNVVKDGKDILNEENLFVFQNASKFKDGYGQYVYDVKDKLTINDETHKDAILNGKQIPSLTASLWYVFDNDYPIVANGGDTQDERNHNLNEQGANYLEIMIVKTNDGFKLAQTKWIVTQKNYYEYVKIDE